jgi:glycosyltransferase involved in cell wall biosynthesis
VDVSVAICTWNRASLLDETLSTMRRLRVPSKLSWELLVVDNNSTDETARVVSSHAGCLPIVPIFEPKQGLSNARNRAALEARGELIIWTDDDVRVDEHWLAEYAKAASQHPAATYFGGRVLPWFEVEPQPWISENIDLLSDTYALRDFGDGVRLLAANEYPVGASMACRRQAMLDVPFNSKLGRQGASLVGGEEIDVLTRLQSRGDHGVWVGTAVARHFIPSGRLSREYVWKWRYGAGQALAREMKVPSGRRIGGVPLWMLKAYATRSLRRAINELRGGRPWLMAYLDQAHAAGMVSESRAGR